MKKTLTAFLFLLVASTLCAQDQKVSATLSYPLPIGSSFIAQNYTGVIEGGLQVRFVNTSLIRMGASFNGSYLTFKDSPSSRTNSVNAYFLQPRVFGELVVPALQKFRPTLAVGYTFVSFRAKSGFADGDPITLQDNQQGFNIHTGFYFNVTNRFFTSVHYDFVKLSTDEEVPGTKENTNISQLKFGIGFRF